MPLFRPPVAALLLLLASCQKMSEQAACGEAADCLASGQGVVVGRGGSERVAARRELQSAAASYSAWFPGEKAPAGLVVLDAGAGSQARVVRGISWTLTYDLANRRARDGASGLTRPGPATKGIGGGSDGRATLAVSRENEEFDVTSPGVLAHEICHRYAAQAFARAWGQTRALPDMLDEVAAISCETDKLKAARLDLFARLFAEGKAVPWEGFLVTGHPLKTDPAMIRALGELGKSGKGALAFEIKPGSSHAAKVALFYSQAAAFGDFVSARSCRGRQAIGQLLATYDPLGGLNQWLHRRGPDMCLPRSTREFEAAFATFVRRRKGADLRPGA